MADSTEITPRELSERLVTRGEAPLILGENVARAYNLS